MTRFLPAPTRRALRGRAGCCPELRWMAPPCRASLFFALLLTLAFLPRSLAAQDSTRVTQELLEWVLPGVTEFSGKEGTPPVFRAYRTDDAGTRDLVGYAFLTSDIPPEERGYDGPIEVLVGMDLRGEITGVLVTYYWESLQNSRGDFLGRQGFQEQFTGKSIADAFRVRRDVDGISGATITVSAMAVGVRNAARRVALAYLGPGTGSGRTPPAPGSLTPAAMAAMGWQEMVAAGLAAHVQATDRMTAALDATLVPIPEPTVGAALLGDSVFAGALERLGADDDRHLFFMGVDGGWAELFRPQTLSFVQGFDTTRVEREDALLLGAPRSGTVDAQFRNVGLLRVSREFDPGRPFTLVFDLRPGLRLFSSNHPGWPGLIPETRVAAADAPVPAATGSEPSDPDPVTAASLLPDSVAGDSVAAPGTVASTPEVSDETEPSESVEPGEGFVPMEPGPAAPVDAGSGALDQEWLDFAGDEEETVWAATLASTGWGRVLALLGLLALTTWAFVSKHPRVRAVTLGATVLLLGFSGGFLSISHVTSVFRGGPAVLLRDLPLLILVVFTVVTTLLWGRIFCGYLCPFGALQDALERIVPRRFRRELPPWMHRRAFGVKYGILAVVVAPALLGSQVSLFQYFEPFGTVFFFSSSLVLWAIAGSFLVASAVVPRFYCRYACPLGAALAIGSLAAPFRIRRVEQCTLCTVCEHACPTGAIRKESINFAECVRCNACETKLIERAGVCRHDMAAIRPRLVQLSTPGGARGHRAAPGQPSTGVPS